MPWMSSLWSTTKEAPSQDPKKEAPSLQNPNYDYMIEIPITDEALEYLEQTCLIQGASYPETYKPNPNLKYERVTGDNLPNLILRGRGFENVWQCFDKVRVFEPNQHVSIEPLPGGEEAQHMKQVFTSMQRVLNQLLSNAKKTANTNTATTDDDDNDYYLGLFDSEDSESNE